MPYPYLSPPGIPVNHTAPADVDRTKSRGGMTQWWVVRTGCTKIRKARKEEGFTQAEFAGNELAPFSKLGGTGTVHPSPFIISLLTIIALIISLC